MRLQKQRIRGGFSLVEMLVVIGLIAILFAMLLPALQRARQQAAWVKCQSNMRQIGIECLIYANNWRGWLYPPGMTGVAREQNWPTIVLKPPQWNSPVLLCPSDIDPANEHSYILNYHLVDREIRYSSRNLGGLTAPEVVVMGEKVTDRPDYYMNGSDFPTRVEHYRHGLQTGSNYLYLDLHVSTAGPNDALGGIDPWDLPPP